MKVFVFAKDLYTIPNADHVWVEVDNKDHDLNVNLNPPGERPLEMRKAKHLFVTDAYASQKVWDNLSASQRQAVIDEFERKK